LFRFGQTITIDDGSSSQLDSNATTTSQVHSCQWCYKQYVLKNKLLKHQRTQHYHLLPPFLQEPQPSKKLGNKMQKPEQFTSKSDSQPQTVNLQFTGMYLFFFLMYLRPLCFEFIEVVKTV